MAILAVNNLIASGLVHTASTLTSEVVACSGLLRATLAVASDALTSCAEEAFHTVDVAVGLLSLLLLLLLLLLALALPTTVVHLRVLQIITTVVSKSGLLAVCSV